MATTPSSLCEKNVKDLSEWLESGGIPQEFCKVFEDNYIDGEAFICLTEQDMKEMVPPIGLVKKIIKIRQTTTSSVLTSEVLPYGHSCSTPTVSASISDMSPSLSEIPSNWRPEVDKCIQEQMLTDSARAEIVRVLVTVLFSQFTKPTRDQCGTQARNLILKYQFMKDDLGNGYRSWEDKMVERVRNVIKRDRKRSLKTNEETQTPKRLKKTSDQKKREALQKRYPPGSKTSEDVASVESHMATLKTELTKARPRDSVLLPLMMSTYKNRRLFILNEALCARDIVGKYPALKRQVVIEQEMNLVSGSDTKEQFLSNWNKFYNAIVSYARTSGKKRVVSLTDEIDEDDEESKQVAALRILSIVIKGELEYLYEKYNSDNVTVEEAMQKPPIRNAPRMTKTENDDEYFIVMEQSVLCKASDLPHALYLTFSSYYIFNIEYPSEASNLFYFFQDYIFNLSDKTKRPSSYIATLSDIVKYLS